MKILKPFLITALTISLLSGTFYSIDHMPVLNMNNNKIPTDPTLFHFVSPTVIKVDQEIFPSNVDELVQDLKEHEKDRTLLVLDSPGGSVAAGHNLANELNYTNTDTYVPEMAASMAADTWVKGKRRFVEPTAILLFHQCRGDFGTASDVRRVIQRLDNIAAKALVAINGADDLSAIQLIKEYNELDSMITSLKLQAEIMENINEAGLHLFDGIIAQSNGKLTREIILHELFHDYQTESFVTGQKLLDMGIATDSGAPNLADYSTKGHL